MSDTLGNAASRIAAILDTVPTGAFIGGRFRDQPNLVPVTNPATGKELGRVSDAEAAVGREAVEAAAVAAKDWAATPPRERSEVLRRAFELCLEHAEELATLMSLEMGKTLVEARGEVAYGAEFFRWFSEEAVRAPGLLRPAPAVAGDTIGVLSRPVGICYLITPWNFPLSMATRKIAPALAAGCTVVLKPATATPLTALYLMELLRQAGVPDGVVNAVVSTDSKGLTSTILADHRVRKLSFTGSTEVGRTLLAQAADRVLRTSMELGGNAPFVVMPSADVPTSVEALMKAKFRNNGEACTAANRILVHASVADEFIEGFTRAASELVIGPGIEESTTLGALIDTDAVERMEHLVAEATERGARCTTGGRRPEGQAAQGAFFEPTVLVEVPNDAEVWTEEIFGPIAPIAVFEDVEAMLTVASDSEFGLVSYLMAQDRGEIAQGISALGSGMIGINTGLVSDPAAPFGGTNQSGIGREGGAQGLAEYLEPVYLRFGA